ncbi:MAG TPA: molybdopterin oxidoreductase, partial [Phycisphaerales bacterium]|nr:molybdopterin oxidoreductase [Phycisphaerales bacterium]
MTVDLEHLVDESKTTHDTNQPTEAREPLSPSLQGRDLWRSLEDLSRTDEFKEFSDREFQEGAQNLEGEDRRQFMKIMGASFALAGLGTAACRRLPETKIAPYANRPDNRDPGVSVEYASTCELGGVAVPVVVTSYDGRPIYLRGNGEHPAMPSDACGSMVQGTVLELYNPDRLRVAINKGVDSTWSEFNRWLKDRMKSHPGGGGFAILTGASNGPTINSLKARMGTEMPSATWTEWEAVNDDNTFLGTKMAFGAPHQVVADLSQADIIVSLDCDFLGNDSDNGNSPAGWASRRRLEGLPADATMSRVYQIEPTLTVSGIGSDERVALRSSRIPAAARAIAKRLGVAGVAEDPKLLTELKASINRSFTSHKGEHEEVVITDADIFDKMIEDLESNRGRCIVMAGTGQPPEVHALAAIINEKLGNVGRTVSYRPIKRTQTRTEALSALVKQMNAGAVKTLVVFDGNPVYDAPADLEFAKALAKVEKVVCFGTSLNETTDAAAPEWVIPSVHYLESWGDATANDGTISIVQPLIQPLVDETQGGRSLIEVLAMLMGDEQTDGLEILRSTTRSRFAVDDFAFERIWRQMLSDGYERGTSRATITPGVSSGAMAAVTRASRDIPVDDGIELVIYQDGRIYDGRYANVGWMQELPDPVSKLTWDNAIYMGPVLADQQGLLSGDMVTLKTPDGSIESVVMVMPGWAAKTCSLSIGYGRCKNAGTIADGAGFNVYPLRRTDGMDLVSKVSFVKTGETYPLASTQDHGIYGSLDKSVPEAGIQERLPSIVREGSLETYQKDPAFNKGLAHVAHSLSLWEETNLDGAKFRWALSVDLTTCTGCSECVVACQAENNIPIVGKDQVIRGREMSWIRIDRYFKGGTASNPEQVVTQPVCCLHCENAPCEQVCPVAATVHDHDGLNVMVYNRCIGTRYCSNNCPYKVRRFNWFDYQRREPVREQEGLFAVKPSYYTKDGPSDFRRMQFNPEVTVRSRGVMEKCSLCAQRIAQAKIKYKNEWAQAGGGATGKDWSIPDGAIRCACEEACSTGAIVFGDLNDPQSKVTKMFSNPRTYDLLAELNTKNRVKYMALVTNPAFEREVHGHGGHGHGHGHGDHGHGHGDHG